jgi:hypothetical protein
MKKLFLKIICWLEKQLEDEMSEYSALCIVGDAGYIIETNSIVLNAHHTHTPQINSKRTIEKAIFVVLETKRYKITPK